MITRTSLRHPTIAWDIEAAMWACIRESRSNGWRMGISCINRNGKHILTVVHYRGESGSKFAFLREGVDISEKIVHALRANAKEAV